MYYIISETHLRQWIIEAAVKHSQGDQLHLVWMKTRREVGTSLLVYDNAT